MPLYDMKCPKCGHEQQFNGFFKDSENVKCEKCGEKTKRKIGAPRFYFRRPGSN